MSLWGFDGGENTLTSWSSLSQFDDMVWNEFGENGDHVVPDPNGNQMPWASGDRRKKMDCDGRLNGISNRDSSTPGVGTDSCTETSISDHLDEDKDAAKGEDVPMQDVLPGGSWSDLGSVVDLPLESQPFDTGSLPVPQETEDISVSEELKDQSVSMLNEDVQLYIGEEDGSMVTDPFSLTEVASQTGELELFGDESTTSKAESLLDLAWANIGNLDDMDKLFRNNDTSFEPVIGGNTDGLEWPSSSPPSVPTSGSNRDSGLQIEKNPPEESKTTVVKVEIDLSENKAQPGSCDESQAALSSGNAQASSGFEDMSSDVASPKSSSLKKSASAHQLPACTLEKNETSHEIKATQPKVEKTEEEAGQSSLSLSESEKFSHAQAQRARRHAANRKRSEDRFKRGASYRKLSPGPPYAVPHGDTMQFPLHMPVQPSHLQPGPAPPGLQLYSPASGLMNIPPRQYQMPQSVPYIQVGYPLHHMSMMPSKPVSHMQYPQPMFGDLQPASIHQQKPAPNQIVNPMHSPLAPKIPFQVSGSIDQQQQLQTASSFDASCRPPTASPSMTPQEKLEKLRWRQQMQARIAVEQQQQQLLASQSSGGIEPFIFHRQQQTSSQSLVPSQPGRLSTESSEGTGKPASDSEQRVLLATGSALPVAPPGENEGDPSLEGSVLRQLELTISQLDIGTRLVIRNALYRLARSARKRRAAGGDDGCSSQSSGERNSGSNAMESSTASDSPSCRGSRATNISEVETETNPIDRTIAKLLFYKPQPQYLPGPLYISENSPYPGVPQLPAGVSNVPWGWSSAAVPPNNGVGPPGPPLPLVPASLPLEGKADERPVPSSGWSPLPVMNGYRPSALPGYSTDPRFGTAFPVSRLKNVPGNLNFASAPVPQNKEERSISPVPPLQTESCSSPGRAVRTSIQLSNLSTSGRGCHVVVKPQDLEFKGDPGKTTVPTLEDNPLRSNPPFVPDRIQTRVIASAGVQEPALGRQFNPTNDSDKFDPGTEAACMTEDTVQFLSSTQDEAGKLDRKPVLESLSFPTGSLDMASQPQDGIMEGLR